MTTHEIELIEGYRDRQGVAHRRVVFGKRLTAADLMQIDADPQAQSPTQYALMLARQAMTAFGDVPMRDKQGKRLAVPIPFLLALDMTDYEDLIRGHDEFLRLTRGDGVADVLSESEIALAVGIERDGVTYDLVTFGKRLAAKDMVEADRKGLVGIARLLFELSRQIASVTSSRHGITLTGIDTEFLESLDIEDLNFVRQGLWRWRESFRRRGNGVSGQRAGDGDVSADAGAASAGGGNSKLVN